MTVKQLIKKLERMPQNATVLTDNGNGWLEPVIKVFLGIKVYYEHDDKDEEEQDTVIITT